MTYDLTEKLRFDDDPVLVIRGVSLTVKSDAAVVLRLMDLLREQGGVTGAEAAMEMLLSPEDRKKLDDMRLKLDDYLAVFAAAVKLAMGEDPEENASGE